MSESRNDTKGLAHGGRAGTVGSLASRALTVVATKSVRASGIRHEDQITRLLEAVCDSASRTAEITVLDMLAEGVPSVLISDLYIPEVARRLGDAWCADQISFAEVTIGVARLQSALRRLGPEWRCDHVISHAADTVVVVVNPDMYHTLGAIMIAGQLRRRGIAVVLSIGECPAYLSQILKRGEHAAVMISSALGEPLESVRKLVEIAKTAQSDRQPVIIGGSILGTDADIRSLTGADHVTSDLDEVIHLCGLTTTNPNDAHSAPEV